MRVNGSAKNFVKRLYGIVSLITIGSFLIYAAPLQAPPECEVQEISPRSRFIEGPQIVVSGKSATVLKNSKAILQEDKKDMIFTYINFLAAKALKNNDAMHTIKESLSAYIRVERIIKRDGLYIKYRWNNHDPPIILHYFLKDKDSRTHRPLVLGPEYGASVLVENIPLKEFELLKNDIRVLFSTEDGCEEEIIQAIDNAQNSIDAAVHIFTSERIMEALERAGLRGIKKIKILLSKSLKNKKAYDRLSSGGIYVVYGAKKDNLEHNKFMIVDNEIMLTGSYNYTKQEEKDGRENLLVLPYRLTNQTKLAAFSISGDAEARMISLIRLAKAKKAGSFDGDKTIDMVLYCFMGKNTAKYIFEAKEAGINIRILLDKDQKNKNGQIEKYFDKLQRRSVGKSGSLELAYYRIPGALKYNEFAIIGGMTFVDKRIILPSVPEAYQNEFNSLWNDSEATSAIFNADIFKGQQKLLIANLVKMAGGVPPGPPPPPPEEMAFHIHGHSPHGHTSHNSHEDEDEDEDEDEEEAKKEANPGRYLSLPPTPTLIYNKQRE
jgi:hypothetical protein